jgi:hypothetical protein
LQDISDAFQGSLHVRVTIPEDNFLRSDFQASATYRLSATIGSDKPIALDLKRKYMKEKLKLNKRKEEEVKNERERLKLLTLGKCPERNRGDEAGSRGGRQLSLG